MGYTSRLGLVHQRDARNAEQSTDLLGDPTGLRMRLCAQWKSEQSPLEEALGIASKHLVGCKLVWMLGSCWAVHKIDALARIGRGDARDVSAVRVKDDQKVPCMRVCVLIVCSSTTVHMMSLRSDWWLRHRNREVS